MTTEDQNARAEEIIVGNLTLIRRRSGVIVFTDSTGVERTILDQTGNVSKLIEAIRDGSGGAARW